MSFPHAAVRCALACLILGVLSSTYVCAAGDFVILAHPMTGVGPEEPWPFGSEYARGQRGGRGSPFAGISSAKPQIVIGNSVQGLVLANTVVLQLDEPRAVTVLRDSGLLYLKANPTKKFVFKEVVVVQPFTLWWRGEGDAKPTMLGRSFVWERDSQVRRQSGQRPLERGMPPRQSELEWELTSATVEELSHSAVRKALPDVDEMLPHAIAEKVIDGRGQWSLKGEDVIAWARNSPKSPTPPPMRLTHGPSYEKSREAWNRINKLPIDNAQVKVTFRLSRAMKRPDGSVILEVDLSNRLPVRVRGMLARTQNDTEFERWKEIDPTRGMSPAERMAYKRQDPNMPNSTTTRSCPFDLAPGEKAVAEFVIPPELRATPSMFRDTQITLSHLERLGDE